MSTRARDTADVVEDVSVALAAKADYALPVNAQTGTTYTFVLADAQKLTTASNAAAVTLTIPPQSSVTWAAESVLRVVNYGAGAVTVEGGIGVTVTNTATTLAQFQSAAAIRTAEDAWTLVPFAGGGLSYAEISSPAKTGTFTSGSDTWDYWDFTSNGTLVVSTAGLLDILVVGGGGNSAGVGSGKAGGGAGAVRYGHFFVSAASHTVTIGAAGGNASSMGTILISGGGQNAQYLSGASSNFARAGGANGGHGGAYGHGIGGSSAPGGGAGGTSIGAQSYSGVSLNYNNSTIEYGRGGFNGMSTVANSGNGGFTPASQAGRVVVRVKV